MRTGIDVTSARDFAGFFSSISIIIDEGRVGALAYGCRQEFPLEPGVYLVEAEVHWCCSAAYTVELPEGDVVELEASLRWRGLLWCLSLLAMFIMPGRIFVVRRLVRPQRLLLAEIGEGLLVVASVGIVFLLGLGFVWLLGTVLE
jgi:hypothetical protein